MVLGLIMGFRAFLSKLQSQESGQDLAEYCLLTALLVLVAAAIFVQSSGGIQAIWDSANTSLTAGNTATSGDSGGSATDASARAH
jgi:Flp pilus assembly pilin Flp